MTVLKLLPLILDMLIILNKLIFEANERIAIDKAYNISERIQV
jgi:hypothetical protein